MDLTQSQLLETYTVVCEMWHDVLYSRAMAWLPFTLFVYEYLVSVCLFMCITLYFNNNKNQEANHSNKTLVKRHQASHGELLHLI